MTAVFPLFELGLKGRWLTTRTHEPVETCIPDGFGRVGCCVDVSDALALAWGSEDMDLDTRNFAPLIPPFPVTWLEARMPAWVYADGGWCHLGGSTLRAGALVWLLPDRLLTMELFHLTADRGMVLHATPVMVDLDESGRAEHTPYIEMPPPLLDAHASNAGLTAQQWADGITSEAASMLFGLSMMNVRNTETENVLPDRAERRRLTAARRDAAAIRYRVVRIPGYNATHAAGGPGDRPSALHVVRGHFKTYTADAPLFGSRTGTWWWTHHVRGDAERGVVVKDYSTEGLRAVVDGR